MENNNKKTKLEQIAEEQRKVLMGRNTYNGFSEDQQYSRTHTRALSDEETPVHGKGTGKYLDTAEGGSSVDRNGDPNMLGSGRNGNIKFNMYNKENPYRKPGMDGDFGDV